MSNLQHPELPVAVIGAGPAGLAAAAQLRSREMSFLVIEAGSVAGAAVREWSHVRLFSPWSELIEPAAAELLETTGWTSPDRDAYPTGGTWADDYLRPLADALGDSVRFGTRVVGVAKRGRDRLVDSGREDETFTVHVETAAGEELISARAVIDASGTWSGPNPLGGDGLPALGERGAADRIAYRIPDFAEPGTRARYAGRHVVVAGTGASAKGALIGLVALAEEHPSTRVSWLVRRASVGAAFAGSDSDELAERGALGRRAEEAVASGPVRTLNSFRTASVDRASDGTLTLTSVDGQVLDGVDEVIALTGFRPDLSMLSEIRLDLDPVLEAPRQLAPLIDPNVHSCGSVEPHGAKVLAQPEVGFYLAGMKSYGRATSFLTLTGFEQTRSIVAEIAGDHESAARVELTLPETGVCGGSGAFDDAASGGCCGTTAGPELIPLSVRP
ncbi:NAD(P)-binding domain-containing protein [Aeromicrobium sp. 9AM]|uniref:NAD(P)-binding domain-containing protein n=1 Tax=Aeromicrobium sp. 9AM TaxID=2653126 RepID=UPI0012F3D840|nr:NAD(P)-binding domain-containing protein [Aeromicrobium sp. 9AM]VXB56467.1 Flavoprotein [Aeromicrobium sp. 9AM]